MSNENIEHIKKKKKKNKKGKFISFDEEVIPKHIADEILTKQKLQNENESDINEYGDELRPDKKQGKKRKKIKSIDETQPEENSQELDMNKNEDLVLKSKKKKKKVKANEASDTLLETVGGESTNNKFEKNRKNGDSQLCEMPQIGEEITISNKKKRRQSDDNDNNNVVGSTSDITPRKKKKKSNLTQAESPGESEQQDLNDPSKPKKKESIRERKRKRHAQLLKEKKLKAELVLQQKALNYLSNWKHNRSEWKFEKLRQIWLQQNMYDEAKLSEEFWGTLIDYFNGSKGKAREMILKDALKVIEEESVDNEDNIKVVRARELIQNLQE